MRSHLAVATSAADPLLSSPSPSPSSPPPPASSELSPAEGGIDSSASLPTSCQHDDVDHPDSESTRDRRDNVLLPTANHDPRELSPVSLNHALANGGRDEPNHDHRSDRSAHDHDTDPSSLTALPPPRHNAPLPLFRELPPPAAIAAIRGVSDLTDTPPWPRSNASSTAASTAASSPRM